MKQALIDVRDLDYTWWEKVEAYRDGGQLHLPRGVCRTAWRDRPRHRRRLTDRRPCRGESELDHGGRR